MQQHQKRWLHMIFTYIHRYHHCHCQPLLRYQTAKYPAFIRDRKLSVLSSPLLQTQAEEDVDDFAEEYIHNYPSDELGDIPEEKKASVNQILLELDVLGRFNVCEVPKNILTKDWIELLKYEDNKERLKFYRSLYLREKIRQWNRNRSREKKLMFVNVKNKEENWYNCLFRTNEVVPYRFHANCMFNMRCLGRSMKLTDNLRVLKKMQLGPHIIIDCSYESHMVNVELNSCARQLAMVRVTNRNHSRPFNIIHCNVNINGVLIKKLHNFVPDLLNTESVFVHTDKNFSDLFPREKLIYLSPHAETELETYDHDAVYVIGAMVDKVPKEGLSVEKARCSGIRTMKFPLEKNFNWCRGTKSLMLHQAIKIMCDLKEGVSWKETLLNHVQHEKTTFAGVYWLSDAQMDPLSSKYIKLNHFLSHECNADKKK